MEIISKESIKPSSPTPDHLRTFRLSMLDQLFPPNCPFTLVIYYTHDNTDIKQAEISPLLKSSLSDALALYYPLAGRMNGEIVNCWDQGVDFFEARVDTCLQDIIESARLEVLTEFAPTALSGGALLGVQLNHFNCGGIGIGITLCHRIGDACTLSMFVNAWAAMARGGDAHTVQAPSFVASALFPPNEALRHHGQVQKTIETPKPKPWGHTRRFCFSSSKIAALKAAVETSAVVQVVKPSRVEVVTTAIWKWFMARKGRAQHGSFKSTHALNIRRRMDPPLSENVFGNLIQAVEASGNREMEMGGLVSKMREAIGKIDGEFLRELQGENGYVIFSETVQKLRELKVGDVAMFTSWCNFPFSSMDFGRGKPVWVSPLISHNTDSCCLIDSMEDIGGIEAWITIDGDWTCDEFDQKEVARHRTQCLDI